jgi:hypothetical protein
MQVVDEQVPRPGTDQVSTAALLGEPVPNLVRDARVVQVCPGDPLDNAVGCQQPPRPSRHQRDLARAGRIPEDEDAGVGFLQALERGIQPLAVQVPRGLHGEAGRQDEGVRRGRFEVAWPGEVD